jgi:hypothetical protein
MRLIVSTAAITCQIKSQDYHAGKTFPDGKLLVFNNATAYEIFSASFYFIYSAVNSPVNSCKESIVN